MCICMYMYICIYVCVHNIYIYIYIYKTSPKQEKTLYESYKSMFSGQNVIKIFLNVFH